LYGADGKPVPGFAVGDCEFQVLSPMSSTRRQFLSSSSAALLGATLSSRLQAAPARRTLGYSLYGMKMVPMAEAFAACARIGYRNVEVCSFPGYPGEPKALSTVARSELRKQLGDLGLTVSSMMPRVGLNGDDAGQAKVLETLRAAAGLGQDLSAGAPPVVQAQLGGGRPDEWDGQKQKMVSRLGQWADTLKSAGAVTVLGTHLGATVNTPARLLWLYHQVARPEVALYYNHIHYAVESVPIEESLPALIPFSRFLHLQDATGKPETKNYLLPGDPEGPTNFPRYFRELERHGYRGPLVVHVSGKFSTVPGYEPFPVAELCFKRMDAALKAAAALS
jgi:sugar phosphate isomerase/epimerase